MFLPYFASSVFRAGYARELIRCVGFSAHRRLHNRIWLLCMPLRHIRIGIIGDCLLLQMEKGEKMKDDLISRQAAYEVLTEYYHHRTDLQHKALKEALERVPAAQGWIPGTERLPKENKPVLVTHHGKNQAFVSVDWIDPYTNEWNRTCNVTAWQPLPEPWKGDKDAEVH